MSEAAATPATLRNALDKLIDVVEEGDSYRALCPVHQGHSLTVRYKADEDTLLVHCKAGCDQAELVQKLRDLGIRLSAPRKRYIYRNAAGETVFAKVRTRSPEGRRITFWECFGSNGVPTVHRRAKGGRLPNGNCTRCGIGPPRGMLYHLPEVRAALEIGDEIWLVAGEKDADALSAAGVCATTSMNGVDDWGPTYAVQLDGAKAIIIVADNDPSGVGKRGAYNRYLSLTDHAGEVAIRVAAEQLKDSADHLAAGHGLNDFVEVDPEDIAPEILGSNGGKAHTDPLPFEELTNLGYANRFVELHRGRFLYSTRAGWRVCEGAEWREDELQLALGAASSLAREMTMVYRDVVERSEDKGGNSKSLLSVARRMEGAGNVLATLRLAQSELAAAESSFDSDATLLVATPGIYRGRGEWDSHDPELRYTKCIPIDYDPAATCPEWDEFLASSIPDEGQREYLYTLIGFALIGGDRRKKRVVNLVGPKDTGKSTFLRVVGEILAPYVSTPAVEELVAGSRRGTDKFALNELRGSRIAMVSETEAHSQFRLAALKALTGGDVISTQGKGTRPVTWRASIMPMIGTNQQIKFDFTDAAFTDRLIAIEYRRGRPIDRRLDGKLDAEPSGIFNRILQGVDRALADQLEEPESIIASRKRAETAVSVALQFLEAALDRGYVVEVPKSYPEIRCCRTTKLYDMYVRWAAKVGTSRGRKLPSREFTRHVSQRYPVPISDTGKHRQSGDGYRHHLGIAFRKDVR